MIIVTKVDGQFEKVGYCDYTTQSASISFRKNVEVPYKAVPILSKELVSFRVVSIGDENAILVASIEEAGKLIPSFKPLFH